MNKSDNISDAVQGDIQKQIVERAQDIIKMIVRSIGKEQYTATEAMPLLIATIAKQDIMLDFLAKKLRRIERESFLTNIIMNDSGKHGHS